MYAWEREQNRKKKDVNKKEEVHINNKGKAKIEEVNAVTNVDTRELDGDVLFMSSLHVEVLATSHDGYSQD